MARCRSVCRRLVFPLIGEDRKVPDEYRIVLPDRMLTLVMTEVERMANDPLPVAQQPPSIAALERELDGLQRVEEVLLVAALATGEPVHRSPSAPPATELILRQAMHATALTKDEEHRIAINVGKLQAKRDRSSTKKPRRTGA